MNGLGNAHYSQFSDQELITMFRSSQDPNVLGALYTRYAGLIFGVCFKYLNHAQQAEDAAMDIYLQLADKILKHEITQFRGWLSVVARNHCLMALRKQGRPVDAEITDTVMYSLPEAHPVDEALEKEQTLLALEKCLDTLSAEQATSIRLFYLEKKCYQTIADETGYAWNKVRSYIQNGKRNLKGCLENNGALRIN